MMGDVGKGFFVIALFLCVLFLVPSIIVALIVFRKGRTAPKKFHWIFGSLPVSAISFLLSSWFRWRGLGIFLLIFSVLPLVYAWAVMRFLSQISQAGIDKEVPV
jgi:hypothetical protein